MTIISITPPTGNTIDADLEQTRHCTHLIRQAQNAITEQANIRREAIIRLRQAGITYRAIAENMGTTEQNIYKILRTPQRQVP